MKINYSDLKNNQYDPHTLNEIKLFADEGIDFHIYINKGYRGRTLTEIRNAYESNVDLSYYLDKGFRDSELTEIRIGLESKLNLKRHIDIDMCDVQIEQIRLGLESKIDVSRFANGKYNWMQMREIRLGVEHNINISLYDNEYFDNLQMKEIREGLEEGLDVSSYAKLMYSVSDMKKKHGELKLSLGIDTYNDEIKKSIEKFNLYVEENISDDPCDILITKDKLCAYMILNRPPKGENYSVNQVIECINDAGVVRGISNNAIKDAIDNEKYDMNILVASVDRPFPGKDGYYEYFFKEELCNKPKVLDDGSVDYHEVDLFESVTKDQLIAIYHKAELGRCGISVEGKCVPGIYGKELPPLKGKGIRTSEDNSHYYACVTGRIERRDYTINVNKVLVIEDDVKPGVGNVSFDGDIIIKGNICNGMVVEATSNVLVRGVVEGATIKCGGSLTVKSGVLGNQKAVLKADKDVYCFFIENSEVYAGEEIHVDYLLGSEVYAGKSICVAGRKGSIIGGYTYAGLEIKAVVAGNKTGIKTEIELGINAEFQKKEFLKYKELKKLQKNMKELIECKSSLDISDNEESVTRYYSRICQAIEMENEYINIIQKEIDDMKNEKQCFLDAKLTVTQGMFPGCIVRKNGNCKRIE